MPSCLSYATVSSIINGRRCSTLIDSDSSKSCIDAVLAKKLQLYTKRVNSGQSYNNFKLGVFNDLCAEVLLGGDFIQKHNHIILKYYNEGDDLIIDPCDTCALTEARVKCHFRFANLLLEYTSISTKPR